MPKEKGALRRISDEVKLEIADYTSRHPEKTRDAIASDLIAILAEKSKGNPVYAPPTQDTLVKRISQVRNTVLNGRDAPWHTGTLKDFPLLPEAIAKIFEIKVKLGWDDISVREAIWLGNFSALPLSLEALKHNAEMYAFYERLSILAGIPFDSDAAERDNKVLMVMLKSQDAGKSLAERIQKGANSLLDQATNQSQKDGEA